MSSHRKSKIGALPVITELRQLCHLLPASLRVPRADLQLSDAWTPKSQVHRGHLASALLLSHTPPT